MASIKELRRLEFDARQVVLELRRRVFDARDIGETAKLVAAEAELEGLSNERAIAERSDAVSGGWVVRVPQASTLLGPDTTGIEVGIDLRMNSIPTSLVHLFDRAKQPLVSYTIRNTNQKTKRLKLVSYVEGYSARAIDTVEVAQLQPLALDQLPTFFPERLIAVTELARATLNLEVQDLDAKTELHKTTPVWLLARTTTPLEMKDPSTGTWKDMTPYLGAFVTPNAPPIMEYLHKAAERHPRKQLVGYQIDKDEVTSEVKAIYEALVADNVRYVNSVIQFTRESGSVNQRVRLPRESLNNASANCIDGTLLFASLLEGISLNPAITIVPGHAFVGWETWRDSGEWRYLETTRLSELPFLDACAIGDQTAEKWQKESETSKGMFKRWSLRDLRAEGITPME